MWQLGHHAVAAGRRGLTLRGTPARMVPLARTSMTLGQPPPQPRPKAKKGGGPSGVQIAGVCLLGGGAVCAASEEARDVVIGEAGRLGERFEDFNDFTREFFESIGDRLVSKTSEPWLLELETMKYPETIPTLVVDLDKVILLLEHDSKKGWHVVKRPFADQFFKELSHYFELVIFSDDVFPVALDIVDQWKLPVTGVLHRDFCIKQRNHYVKDISKLGRSLERTLIIDHDPSAFQLQPENGLHIKAFDGDPNDSELADLLDFLKAAATSNQDLRQFVQRFGGGDTDLGKRYLLHKQDQDKLVEQRRGIGRAFAARSTGFPSAPPKGFGNNMMIK